MAAALLDLQHYCPGLVAAAAAAALAQMAAADAQPGEGSSLGPEEVVSLLLALAFFRLEAPQFVQEALEVRRQGCCASDVQGLAGEAVEYQVAEQQDTYRGLCGSGCGLLS